MPTWKKALALGACAVLALGACSREDSSREAAEPTVDEALLDTGDNPTTPQEPFGKIEQENVLDFESQRLAEYVPLPYEIDPELTDRSSTPLQTIRSSVQADGRYTGAAIYKANDMAYGFISSGETPVRTAEDEKGQKLFKHQVTRFLSPDGPVPTADGLEQYYLTGAPPDGTDVSSVAPDDSDLSTDPPIAPSSAEEIPGHPDARAYSLMNDDGKLEVHAFTPHGDFLYSDSAKVPPEQKQWALDAIAHAIDIQHPMIDKFPGLGTDLNPRPESAPPIDRTIDQDKILIYTIPGPEDSGNMNGAGRAVYGPRGYAQLSGDQKQLYADLNEAGVENIAFWGTSVMRAADDDKAETLFDKLIRNDTDDGAKIKESPVGLPTAKCVSKADTSGITTQCYVRNGRYIGISFALDDEKAAHQEISAEYKILQQADQNA